METVLITIHLMVVLALIGAILLQRSEGGALGIGGGGGGFMSARGAGDILTRTTAILAVVFFATSISLTLYARNADTGPGAIFNNIDTEQQAPASTGEGEGEESSADGGVLDILRQQSQPTGPQVPQSE